METHYPEHYAIELAARQDYASFFEKELHFRRMMHYPPFVGAGHVARCAARICNRPFAGRGELENIFRADGIARSARCWVRRRRAVAAEARVPFQFLLKSPRRSALHGVLEGCLGFCVVGDSRARGAAGCGPGESASKRKERAWYKCPPAAVRGDFGCSGGEGDDIYACGIPGCFDKCVAEGVAGRKICSA